MIHQKYGGQVGKTISYYPAFRDPVRRDNILEKFPTKSGQVVDGGMSSLSKRYSRLIPQTGGVVFTP